MLGADSAIGRACQLVWRVVRLAGDASGRGARSGSAGGEASARFAREPAAAQRPRELRGKRAVRPIDAQRAAARRGGASTPTEEDEVVEELDQPMPPVDAPSPDPVAPTA